MGEAQFQMLNGVYSIPLHLKQSTNENRFFADREGAEQSHGRLSAAARGLTASQMLIHQFNSFKIVVEDFRNFESALKLC